MLKVVAISEKSAKKQGGYLVCVWQEKMMSVITVICLSVCLSVYVSVCLFDYLCLLVCDRRG